ncbi:hypothetical protein [Maridesulfovibrio ferrireducens]|uniref:hypothetical protein n=1 Tax=Maridesulfovibrio ferrireducens TaxID=246191 RepID=UPI001A2AD03B|nr:hypothetical protein [Maridesulfovibrio ferrireducens]MBI9110010.1 hypothetical protein [Maridesulfovibrio ferrireducens]
MFSLYLQALEHGSPDLVLEDRFYNDLQNLYAETNLLDCPEQLPSTIMETEWYKQSGWQEVRKAAYGPWEMQNNLQYDGLWMEHVAAVKVRFPKPEGSA